MGGTVRVKNPGTTARTMGAMLGLRTAGGDTRLLPNMGMRLGGRP